MAASYGKHRNSPRGTTRAIGWLREQPGVTRVILGEYHPHRRGRPGFSVVKPCRGGLHLRAHADSVTMDVFAHTADPEGLASRVRDRYGERP
jgi:hypothetical protein